MKAYYLQQGEERYQEYLEKILEGSIMPPGLDESCIDPLDGRIRCRAGNASFWITWDGQMLPCGMVSTLQQDLYQMNFKTAWSNLTNHCDNVKLSGVCSHCDNQDLCHVCAAMAVAETGKISGIPVYLCQTVEAMKEIAMKELRMEDKKRI